MTERDTRAGGAVPGKDSMTSVELQTQLWYLHVEDLVAAYVGPFNNQAEAQAHFEWCRDVRHDSAVLKGFVRSVPAGEFLVSPHERVVYDRAWTDARAGGMSSDASHEFAVEQSIRGRGELGSGSSWVDKEWRNRWP